MMPRTTGYRDYGSATWHIYTECPHRKHTGLLHPVLATERKDENLCDFCRKEDAKESLQADQPQ
jgi:hypothetical protein